MRPLIHKAAMAATMAALTMAGALAHAAAVLPPVHKSGAVEYLSGGIGKDESSAIERASKQWPLTLEFAVKDKQRADFAADVKVLVRDDKGHAALDVVSDGPLLLAKLAPGHYGVYATFAGKTLHRNVVVKSRQPVKAVFDWPAGSGESRS